MNVLVQMPGEEEAAAVYESSKHNTAALLLNLTVYIS